MNTKKARKVIAKLDAKIEDLKSQFSELSNFDLIISSHWGEGLKPEYFSTLEKYEQATKYCSEFDKIALSDEYYEACLSIL